MAWLNASLLEKAYLSPRVSMAPLVIKALEVKKKQNVKVQFKD